MEDDNLMHKADTTIDSPVSRPEMIDPRPATEDAGEPELRTNGLEVSSDRQDAWNESSYSGSSGSTAVIQPSESFQLDKPEPEFQIEQTDNNVEIGSSHMETENYPVEEAAPVEPAESEPQAPVTEQAVAEAPITPVAPAQLISEPKKSNKTILMVVIGVVLLACAGILVFALTR